MMANRYLNFQPFLDVISFASMPVALGKSVLFKRFKMGALVFHAFNDETFEVCFILRASCQIAN